MLAFGYSARDKNDSYVVIATERGILRMQKGLTFAGTEQVQSEFHRATWTMAASGSFPVVQSLWEHRFIQNIEDWAQQRRVARWDHDQQDVSAIYDKLDLADWLDDNMGGGEQAWAHYAMLVGLDAEPEVAGIISADALAAQSARYESDTGWGSF